MNVKLIVQKRGKPAQAFRLRSEETIIGRRQGCDVRVPSDAVSRRHCLISLRNGSVMVEDLASVNGTFVNGKRITSRQLLYPGDQLEVGPITFIVQYTQRPAASDSAPVVPLSEEDVPELELAGDESDLRPLRLVEDEQSEDEASDSNVIAEIDEAGGLNLPESEELRDILTQMDDSKPRKKKSS